MDLEGINVDFVLRLLGSHEYEFSTYHVVSIYDKNDCDKRGLGCKSDHLKLGSFYVRAEKIGCAILGEGV